MLNLVPIVLSRNAVRQCSCHFFQSTLKIIKYMKSGRWTKTSYSFQLAFSFRRIVQSSIATEPLSSPIFKFLDHSKSPNLQRLQAREHVKISKKHSSPTWNRNETSNLKFLLFRSIIARIALDCSRFDHRYPLSYHLVHSLTKSRKKLN